MAAQSNVQIKATANVTQATSELQKLGNATENVSDGLKDITREGSQNGSAISSLASKYAASAVSIAAVAAAMKQVYEFGKECVQIYVQQEKAETRLQAVLKATGNQYNINASSLVSYANELERKTNLDSAQIVEAVKLLVATKALNEDGLKRTLEVSAELAVAMGTDITSAAQMMVRALQDPVSGLRSPRSAAISFTDAEQEQIKAMMEANNLAGAQELVLAKVEGAYKGVADAIKGTDSGKLDTISTALGNIKKNFGSAILDEISPALDWIIEKLGYVESWSAKVKGRTSITSSIKANGVEGNNDLENYSVSELEQWLEDLNGNIPLSYKNYFANQGYLSQLRNYIDSRKGSEVPEPPGVGTSTTSPTESQDPDTSAIGDWLSKYGSSSTSWLAQSYQSIIDSSRKLQEELDSESTEYLQLQEIVDAYQDKLDL